MTKLRLIVLGMMGRCPYGGQTWLYLNWLRGLAANGHEVWYVEDDSVWPYDPEQNTVTFAGIGAFAASFTVRLIWCASPSTTVAEAV